MSCQIAAQIVYGSVFGTSQIMRRMPTDATHSSVVGACRCRKACSRASSKRGTALTIGWRDVGWSRRAPPRPFSATVRSATETHAPGSSASTRYVIGSGKSPTGAATQTPTRLSSSSSSMARRESKASAEARAHTSRTPSSVVACEKKETDHCESSTPSSSCRCAAIARISSRTVRSKSRPAASARLARPRPFFEPTCVVRR
mmetsp:Transcript_31972/g.95084  ORF Transcript_31972/g.95084 Transcript_31972/m.95084 type:complete len:202 (+) Transcript_31972:1683-2288(+)